MEHEELIDCHKCGYTHSEGYNCGAVSASGSNDLLCDVRFKLLLEYCENVQTHLPTSAKLEFRAYKRTFINT